MEDCGLVYNRDYNVVICTLCKFAVVPSDEKCSGITHHLKYSHALKFNLASVRDELVGLGLAPYKDVVHPQPGIAPIDNLELASGF
ncbi:hypothetical protein LPJ61_006106, partial [Coemansia biformis]